MLQQQTGGKGFPPGNLLSKERFALKSLERNKDKDAHPVLKETGMSTGNGRKLPEIFEVNVTHTKKRQNIPDYHFQIFAKCCPCAATKPPSSTILYVQTACFNIGWNNNVHREPHRAATKDTSPPLLVQRPEHEALNVDGPDNPISDPQVRFATHKTPSV